jgi:hypothetical protein
MLKYGVLLAIALGGCGDGGGGTTTTGGSSTGGNTTSASGGSTGRSVSFNCCLNGQYFDCPSQAALDKCVPPDFMGTPDPSQCTRNTNKDGTCSQGTSGGTSGGTTGSAGGCSNAHVWNSCTVDSDCHSTLLHCTSGNCYSNIFGSPCTVDSDCGNSAHCTSGCCYTNQRGNPCTVDSDCGAASSCVNGKCN